MRSSTIPVLTASLIFGWMTGCASYPISSATRQQAQADVTVGEVQQDLERYRNAVVIWGGQITENANTPSGSVLTVTALPLDDEGVPILHAASQGQFIAKSAQFLDPSIYGKGLYITVAGPVTGLEQKSQGTLVYAFPVIRLQEFHLWQQARDFAGSGYYDWLYGDGYWYDGWAYDYYYPFWIHPRHDHYHYRPRPRFRGDERFFPAPDFDRDFDRHRPFNRRGRDFDRDHDRDFDRGEKHGPRHE